MQRELARFREALTGKNLGDPRGVHAVGSRQDVLRLPEPAAPVDFDCVLEC